MYHNNLTNLPLKKVSLLFSHNVTIAEKKIKRLTKKLKQIEKLEQLDRDLTLDEQNKMFKKDDIVRKLEALKLE